MVHEDAIIDGRAFFTGFAGAFLGPLGAAVAVAVGGAGQLALGAGAMALVGILVMVAAAGAGLAWARLNGRSGPRWSRLLILGLGISVSFAAYLLVPGFGRTESCLLLATTLTAFNLAGSLLLGGILLHERQRTMDERSLRLAAETDALTGLLNRRGFVGRFRQAESLRASRGSAFLLVDLDHFKQVNDTYGHAAGDALLRETGRRLLGAVRPQDVVLRMGGEEFGVLLSDVGPDETLATAERIRRAIRPPCDILPEAALSVTASIGGACWATGSASLEEVAATADMALYRAKASGRDRAILG
jgi:diguanylate cyclase